MAARTILFMAANPVGTNQRALDALALAIEEELRGSRFRERFRIETRWAAQPLDLLREMVKLKPTVVHFCGGRIAGACDAGVYFQSADGSPQPVPIAALAKTFQAAGASVKLVVLDACYSDAHADALAVHIDCVVGTAGDTVDGAATSFAIGLYGGLGEGESVKNAVEHGSAAIGLIGNEDPGQPKLRVRPGSDASQLFVGVPAITPLPTPAMSSSYGATWAALEPDARLVLQVAAQFATRHVPMPLVTAALARLGKTADAIGRAVDDARDRMLATGDIDHLDLHPLVASFVRERAPLEVEVHRAMFDGLLDAAHKLAVNTGDLGCRGLVMAHSLDANDWTRVASGGAELHIVGNAICELDQFAIALPWYQSAAAAKETGDSQGRVDQRSLAASLHQVGYCHSSLGRFSEALPWYERAVHAKEGGDANGQVEHASLAETVFRTGDCYLALGQPDEALARYQRAIAFAEQPDDQGRVDHTFLGAALHQVGLCCWGRAQLAEALAWFERAVEVTKQGDRDGRVDYTSLGRTLHQVARCRWSEGRPEEALQSFARAVLAKKRGDVDNRVDHESLGVSLHEIGHWYASQDRFAEALPWFERAAAARQQGDVRGRIDHEGVSLSLHRAGRCRESLGRFAEALPWFKRAVAASEKGDLLGRVNNPGLIASINAVAECYRKLGQYTEAQRWLDRAAELDPR